MNHKQKIGLGALIALAMIMPLGAAQVPGITVTCTNPEEIGYNGAASGPGASGAHASYVTTEGLLVVGQDGCLTNAVNDTDAFFFSGGSDDGLGVSGTFLYARVGSTSITDSTPQNSGPHTYTGQGDGVKVCMSPNATAHHGSNANIGVKDTVLGGVSFSVAVDWYRSVDNAPVQSTSPPDRLPPDVRAIIASVPVVGDTILFIYDNQIRSQPQPITPGPGNDAGVNGCGDGTIEPCPAGVDENTITAANPSGCNNLDHLWTVGGHTCFANLQAGIFPIPLGDIVADPTDVIPVATADATFLAGYPTGGLSGDLAAIPGCLLAGPTHFTVGVDTEATVNGNTATDLNSIAGGDGAVAVFINDPATAAQIWTY